MANQGILQAQLKVKNSINLENGFIDNPLLKSVEGNGEINLTDENSFKGFASNTAIEHLDPIKSSSQNAVDLTNSLNNLPNLKYAKLEGNFNSDVQGKFSGNTAMQKLDLSESLVVKPEDFKNNNNLRELPKLDYSNPDLTDIITNDTELKSTTIDLSNQNNTTKLGIHGDSTHIVSTLDGIKVSTEAPFDNQITPQIDVSYTSLDRNGLVNLFNTMPYNVGYQVVGNPTIVDGVVSGLTDSNYLVTNSSADFSTVTEFVMKVKTPAAKPSVGTYIFCGLSSSTKANLLLNDNSFFLSANGISLLVFKIGYEVNTWYWLKYTNDGTTQKAYYSTDGINYTLNATQTNTVISSTGSVLYFGRTAWGAPDQYSFGGSIDLNHSYIKVNSKVSTGPVGYKVIGSPTIVDGIASNFATDSYLQVSSQFQRSQTSWEIQIRATPGTGYAVLMGSRSAADWRIQFSKNDSTINVGNGNITKSFDNALDVNTFYNVKIVRSNNDVSVYLDNVLMASNSAEFTGTGNQVMQLGNGFYNWQNRYPYDGKIDTNNTYIKVNGKLWFGHESKQVTWFNGKPSQTKVVDITGATGTSLLTNDDKAIVTNKGWTLVTE